MADLSTLVLTWSPITDLLGEIKEWCGRKTDDSQFNEVTFEIQYPAALVL